MWLSTSTTITFSSQTPNDIVYACFAEDGTLLHTYAYQDPFDVAVMPSGHIIMIDNNNGLKVFDRNFQLLKQVHQDLFCHSAKAKPMGIAIDQHDGTVTVAEELSHKIHKIGFN